MAPQIIAGNGKFATDETKPQAGRGRYPDAGNCAAGLAAEARPLTRSVPVLGHSKLERTKAP